MMGLSRREFIIGSVAMGAAAAVPIYAPQPGLALSDQGNLKLWDGEELVGWAEIDLNWEDAERYEDIAQINIVSPVIKMDKDCTLTRCTVKVVEGLPDAVMPIRDVAIISPGDTVTISGKIIVS